MQCIKCGRGTQGNHAFCPDCLADMEKYPVAPGSPVQLPSRPDPVQKKPAAKKKPPTDKEKLERLFLVVRWMALCIAILALALGIALYALLQPGEPAPASDEVGRNYITMTPSEGG